MEKACINHPEELAVGFCGGCGAPTCYRCSMNVDQMVYCSLECFNQLNPPSSIQIPKVTGVVNDVSADRLQGLQDEYSGVMEAMAPPRAAAAPPPPLPPAPATAESAPVSLEDPSIILSAALAEEGSTITLPRVQKGPGGEDSTLVIIPGTRRSILSSSCFFHPDTSAIVLCSECRNPICSLCARETERGLACSPSCGPADPAREDDRRKDLFLTFLLAAGVLLVLAGGAYILRSAGHVQAMGTLVATASPSETSDPAPAPRPAEPAPAAPAPRETAVPAADPPPPVPTAPIVLVRPALPRPAPEAAPVVEAEPEPAPIRSSAPEPLRPPAVPVSRRSPEPPRLSPYELDVHWASALVGEAAPLVREVSDRIGSDVAPGPEVYALSAKLDRAVVKLRQARELYVRRIAEAPDRGALEDRLAAITDALKAAQEGFERLGGVPQWRR